MRPIRIRRAPQLHRDRSRRGPDPRQSAYLNQWTLGTAFRALVACRKPSRLWRGVVNTDTSYAIGVGQSASTCLHGRPPNGVANGAVVNPRPRRLQQAGVPGRNNEPSVRAGLLGPESHRGQESNRPNLPSILRRYQHCTCLPLGTSCGAAYRELRHVHCHAFSRPGRRLPAQPALRGAHCHCRLQDGCRTSPQSRIER